MNPLDNEPMEAFIHRLATEVDRAIDDPHSANRFDTIKRTIRYHVVGAVVAVPENLLLLSTDARQKKREVPRL